MPLLHLRSAEPGCSAQAHNSAQQDPQAGKCALLQAHVQCIRPPITIANPSWTASAHDAISHAANYKKQLSALHPLLSGQSAQAHNNAQHEAQVGK